MIFEWDEEKNRINVEKHGIEFNDAKAVFLDPDAIVIDDDDHSYNEDRFLIIGKAYKNILFVCFCIREKETKVIRIISARKADKEEREEYYAHH